MLIEGLDEELSNKRKKEYAGWQKENHMRLGFEFECYIFVVKIKKRIIINT